MPRQISVAITCDQCGDVTDDNPTIVRLGRREVETDLCESHRETVAEVLGPFLDGGRRVESISPTSARAEDPCPYPTCSKHHQPMAKSGFAIHLSRKHGGLLPDGTPYVPLHAPADARQYSEPCPHPGCDYKGKNQNGVSVHMYRKHGYSAFGSGATPVPTAKSTRPSRKATA